MPIKYFLFPLAPDGTRIRVRRLVHDVVTQRGLPKCAWCRLQPLIPLCDFVQHGFTVNHIETACYCEACDKGTIVEYEIALEVE